MATSSWTTTTETATLDTALSTSINSSSSPRFTLHATLGSYGYSDKIAERLNLSCALPPPHTTTPQQRQTLPPPSSSSSTSTIITSTATKSFASLATKFLFSSSGERGKEGKNGATIDDLDEVSNDAATATKGTTNSGTSSSSPSSPRQQQLKFSALGATPTSSSTRSSPPSAKNENGFEITIIGQDPLFVASVSNLEIEMTRIHSLESQASSRTSAAIVSPPEAMWSRIMKYNSTTVTSATSSIDSSAFITMGLFVPPHVTAKCLEVHYHQQQEQQQQQQEQQQQHSNVEDDADSRSTGDGAAASSSSSFSSARHIHASGSSFWIHPPASMDFVHILVPKIHHDFPIIGVRLVGILLTNIASNGAAADLVLLQVPRVGLVSEALSALNGHALAADNRCIIKVLQFTDVNFTYEKEPARDIGATYDARSEMKKPPSKHPSNDIVMRIPVCPVCIHRIDPTRLGLPPPSSSQICSKYCPSPRFIGWVDEPGGADSLMSSSSSLREGICQQQRFLQKWPSPSRCKACEVIDRYWSVDGGMNRNNHGRNNDGNGIHNTAVSSLHHTFDETRDLFCARCSMHKTLWVCLTCGYVGCGRYSNRHSVEHFEQTNHPYSLELATLRIWDYCAGDDGGFVQRADLLSCASSPPLAYPWRLGHHSGLNGSFHSDGSGLDSYSGGAGLDHSVLNFMQNEKPSKKTVMVGVEYEALLQSALEDQAMFYEGEIARLTAELTHFLVHKQTMSSVESTEIQELQDDIQNIKNEIARASRDLLEAQAHEANRRKTSQRLLSEQQVSSELLKKIQEEHRKENMMGKQHIEDLEQQIADLSANLRMRQQFSSNEELNNAQIFGTVTTSANSKVRGRQGKKKGRTNK